MYAPVVTIIPLLLSPAWAYTTNLYTTPMCTGAQSAYNASVADGCQDGNAGSFLGMIVTWQSEADNNLVLATYSNKGCCHADTITTYDWLDMEQCTQVDGSTQSWRVLNPYNSDQGKPGQDYSCNPASD